MSSGRSEDYHLLFDRLIALLKDRKGLTMTVEKQLAKKQWDDPSLRMGDSGGVAEAEALLSRVPRARAMMLRT